MALFRVPRPVQWIFYKRIWRVNQKNTVFLTFDDGPSGALTSWILDTLRDHQVSATFFCVGENVLRHHLLADQIRAEGHLIANHTMRHDKGTKITTNQYLESIKEADRLIRSDLFRPPYGRVRIYQTRNIRKNHKIVMWTWLSRDYDPEIKISTILESAEKSIRAGDILLLHDNVKVDERIRILLPEIIRIVQNKGLTFGLLSV